MSLIEGKILSICIPTLPEPKSETHMENLMSLLRPQMTDEVEYVIDKRDRRTPTGTKRNDMYVRAKGKYVCSIDCDDWIAPDYVSEILIAIKNNYPDVVTFDGWYTENGVNKIDWSIKLGERYEARHDMASGGKYMFFRWPNHLSVMKQELATRVKFPEVFQGEDYTWSLRIKELGLLKTEIHIYKQLYHYRYMTIK